MGERAPRPWSANAVVDERGLSVGGIPAEELAARFGTPLLVVDEVHLRERARAFARLFPHPLYAVKAFTSHHVIRLVLEEGLDLLAATDGEVEACLRAGAPASRIVLHGNAKSDAELRLAVSEGLRLVNVDNAEELERLDALARELGAVQDVMLRVLPEIGAGAHRAIRTGQAGSKFGMPVSEIPSVLARAMELAGVRPVGLHAHIGSQVLEVEPYLAAVDVLLDLLLELRERTGFEADLLDLGGGFGVAYTDENPMRLDEIAPALLERVREGARRRGLRVPHTFVEPGRSVVGQAMLTLYRVANVKEREGISVVAVDGGMSDNIRPMLYGARYRVAFASPPRTDGPVRARIVGRHCESGDVLASDVELPGVPRRGDLLAFAATGAYTYSMASTYNRVGRPAVVGVQDGRARPWLRREDAADLDRLEIPLHPRRAAAPPPGVEIRAARPADAASCLELLRDVAAEGELIRTEIVTRTVRDLRRRFRRAWTQERADLVAREGERVIGSLSISRESAPAVRHVATLGMHVAADRRGRGIGSALLSEAIRWAREMGVEKLELSVYPGNRAAIGLYRRFGFVEEGRLSGHSKKSSGYRDEILMGVWLEGEG